MVPEPREARLLPPVMGVRTRLDCPLRPNRDSRLAHLACRTEKCRNLAVGRTDDPELAVVPGLLRCREAPWLALAIIVAMLATILMFIRQAWKHDRLSAWLFVPYAAWVAFATTLNGSIALMN